MSTWADPTATWADPVVTWTGGDGTTPEPPAEEPRRTNFLISGWYFDQQEPFYEVVDWAEGRGEPFYV